jgi:hypothetical protein
MISKKLSMTLIMIIIRKMKNKFSNIAISVGIPPHWNFGMPTLSTNNFNLWQPNFIRPTGIYKFWCAIGSLNTILGGIQMFLQISKSDA